jgi:hypothetical protein
VEAIQSQPSPVKAAESHPPAAAGDKHDRPRQQEQISGTAAAALVLGLISVLALGLVFVGLSFWMVILVLCLAGIPAIVLGLLSLNELRRSRGRFGSKGMAIAALIFGCIGMVLPTLFLIDAVLLGLERPARTQVSNNLKLMTLAMVNWNDANGYLPFDRQGDRIWGRPGPVTPLSWRVLLLPYFEEPDLYKQFHFDEPWDSPHNKALLTPMPKVFQHPKHPDSNAQGLTYYRVFVGEHAPFAPRRMTLFPGSFPDGTSNTILIVEAADPVFWTKPDELPYDPAQPLPRLGGHFRGGGFLAGMADGSVHMVSPGISERTLRSAIDPADGRPLAADWWKGGHGD